MDYKKIYNDLISSRMLVKDVRLKERKDGMYYERHHIIMKSKGGSNIKSNIVLLTAREHFLSHWILWRIYRDRQSALAFHKMLSKNNLRQNEFRQYSSRGYEEARLAFRETNKGNKYGSSKNAKKIHRMKREEEKKKHSLAMKGLFKGEKNPFYGKKHDKKTRDKISIKAIERFQKNNVPGTIVLNTFSGIFYENIKLCANAMSINYNTLRDALNKKGVYKGIIST